MVVHADVQRTRNVRQGGGDGDGTESPPEDQSWLENDSTTNFPQHPRVVATTCPTQPRVRITRGQCSRQVRPVALLPAAGRASSRWWAAGRGPGLVADLCSWFAVAIRRSSF